MGFMSDQFVSGNSFHAFNVLDGREWMDGVYITDHSKKGWVYGYRL
jgi:hypothetical protein